jgi:5-methylcytosine-specific restriction endonuclease McrA
LAVFVLDKRKKPLMPGSGKRARLLLTRGRAVVHPRHRFTIRLKDRVGGDVGPVRVKIDPGSKTMGVALIANEDGNKPAKVLCLFELAHRGRQLSEALTARWALRRRRRGANLRYRAPQFDNRPRAQGWLAPSDTRAIEKPEISGVAYQPGPLAGDEVREYLLQKFGRACAYRGVCNVPLQIEHVISRARGGSDRVSNLTLACVRCNTEKGARPVEEFLARKPAVLARIKAQAPLKDAAAVNAARSALYAALADTGLPLEASSGGRTTYNRARLGIAKTHALDPACVGEVATLVGCQIPSTEIKASGRGDYCRTKLTPHAFPRGYCMRTQSVRGFQTGDMVRAEVPNGKQAAIHVRRVAVGASGSFTVRNADGINAKYCKLLDRAGGYGYAWRPALPPPAEAGGLQRGRLG